MAAAIAPAIEFVAMIEAINALNVIFSWLLNNRKAELRTKMVFVVEPRKPASPAPKRFFNQLINEKWQNPNKNSRDKGDKE